MESEVSVHTARTLVPIPVKQPTSSRARSEPALPVEPWRIVETRFDPKMNLLRETLFALANGHVGTRGTHDEAWLGDPSQSMEGTYVNAFFEIEPIRYPEIAPGLARVNEFMLNLPNAKGIEIAIEGEVFNLALGTVRSYERRLDFREGELIREVEWVSPTGRRVKIVSRRLVSLRRPEIMAQSCAVTPLNFSGAISLTSITDPRARNVEAGDDPRFGSSSAGDALKTIEASLATGRSSLVSRTRNSDLVLHTSTIADIQGGAVEPPVFEEVEGRLIQRFHAWAGMGATVTLSKFTARATSRDHAEADLAAVAETALSDARAAGFDGLAEEQRRELATFWERADVEIEGDEALRQGLRFNLFHLFQSAGRDGRTNIAAKGLTGEGYEGHYFWDTEIYIFPVFLHTRPDIARALLCHRVGCLAKARERARVMSHVKGALYPWRTITGEECSAYFPAGTAQYHINADIAHAIKQYVEATGDDDFLFRDGGAEVVLETARIWMDLGHIQDGRFHIDEVTGPDEYTALVNNNLYTNVMAKTHLAFAAETARRMEREAPESFAALASRIDLDPAEIAAWDDAAERMCLPFDERLGIHAQDDVFLSRRVWDFASTPAENYPLLLHYHPLVIYRHQVCKQADVVLALFLRGDLFTLEQKRNDFEYYEAITTHDSSLSSCVHSIVASEIGLHEKAYEFFMETARMDLDNTHGNTFHGVHTAAMAGAWMCVVHGFAGLRRRNGIPVFDPHLPAGWTRYRFKILSRGRTLEVTVATDRIDYRLLDGDALEIVHAGSPVRLTAEAPLHSVVRRAPFVKRRFKAVIFDLDGVVTDTARFHHQAWKRLAESVGVSLDETFAENLKGVDRVGSLNMILARGSRTFDEAEKAILADRKNEWYKESIATMTAADLLPGAVEALRAVRAAGLRVGLASVSHNAPTILERLGITDLFDHVVDARTLRRGKPDPEIFLAAAARLGVDPVDCLGVEDAVAGVAAIKAAGMVALGIGDPTVLWRADAVIPGLDAFRLEDFAA